MNEKSHPLGSVLLVCSSRRRQELLSAMLAVGGYNTILATDGHDMLDRVSQNAPDLIILESHLGEESSYALCIKLRKNKEASRVPIIILCDQAESECERKAIEAGADDCMKGLVAISDLLAKTSALLHDYHRFDELIDIESVLLTLTSAIDVREPWERGHLERVVAYATRLGRAVGLNDAQLRDLHRGAVLHDTGKLGVPETILTKLEPLTELDWRYIKLHPAIGEKICQPLGQGQIVAQVIRYHHERFDGQGYPDGLAGEEIPLPGRIVALADTYDALTSYRPYRVKLTPQQALDVLRSEAGKQFDPELVALFIPLVREQD